jgi:hypothetical protein
MLIAVDCVNDLNALRLIFIRFYFTISSLTASDGKFLVKVILTFTVY